MFKNFFQYANKEEKRSLITKLAIIVAIFILAIIIILLLAHIILPKKETRIDNLYDYAKNLPQSDATTIYSMLYRIIEFNSAENAEIPTSGALIRTDTFTEKTNKETNEISNSFIVDIASIRQSYFVKYSYTTNASQRNDYANSPFLITCVPTDKIIYEDFNCKELYIEQPTTNSPLTDFLPYRGKTADGESLIVGSAYYPEGNLYDIPFHGFTLRIYGRTCGNPSKEQPFIDATSTWMSKLNFKLEDYQHEFVDTCPPTAHDEY